MIKKYIYPIVAIVLLTTSCEKEIEVDLKSVPPRIVIEGMVKEGLPATVKVSTTLDFDDNGGYPFITDAIVKISDDKGKTEMLNQDGSGWYVSHNLKGEMGRTYNLSVTYDNVEYTATSKMPPRVAIDSLTTYKIKVMDYALPMIHFTDPKGVENQYYRCLVYINGKQRHDTQELVTDAKHTDGDPLHLLLPIFSSGEENVTPIAQGDEIMVEAQCIDEGVFTFYNSMASMENSLTNPTTNIKGGALGVFSAYSYDQSTTIATWKE